MSTTTNPATNRYYVLTTDGLTEPVAKVRRALRSEGRLGEDTLGEFGSPGNLIYSPYNGRCWDDLPFRAGSFPGLEIQEIEPCDDEERDDLDRCVELRL